MSTITIRRIAADERDAVLDLLAGWHNDREFFARYFRHDPSFRDDLCFVAADGARLVSTLQVFTRCVRAADTVLTVGGVGNVYTAPAYRRRGLAPVLLRRAIAAMDEHGFDVSLLFATRLELYGALGWQSHARHLSFIDPGRATDSGRYRLSAFDLGGDLDSVMALYDQHCRNTPGTTVRDRGYWLGQLRYAGNPGEQFVIARQDDAVVAYARSTFLYGFNVVIEHAVQPGHQNALADLFARLHGREQPGTLCQLACEAGFADLLRARGLSVRTVEDVFWMWRVVRAAQLAAKLGISPEATRAPGFFPNLFRPEHSRYWLSDRF